MDFERELLTALGDVKASLGRVEGKMDGIVTSQTRQRADHNAHVALSRRERDFLTGRIGKLENWRWYVVGVTGACGIVGGAAFRLLTG